MSVLPRKFLLVLEASLYIAQHAGINAVSGKEICAHVGLSSRHLEPLLQALVHHGILRGIRGPKGGYLLLKERRKVTLKELFLLSLELEKNESLPELLEKSPYGCIIKPLSQDIEAAILFRLEEETLDDLCSRAETVLIKPEAKKDRTDFTI